MGAEIADSAFCGINPANRIAPAATATNSILGILLSLILAQSVQCLISMARIAGP